MVFPTTAKASGHQVARWSMLASVTAVMSDIAHTLWQCATPPDPHIVRFQRAMER